MRARIWLFAGGAVLALATAAVGFAGGPVGMMGPAHRVSISAFQGYYDGHKDAFLGTDVSSRAEAKADAIDPEENK